MSHIIGIGGPSRSGKTSLAKQITDQLIGLQVSHLDMDDFVFPSSEIPKIKERTDWEVPESVNYDLLISKIRELKVSSDVIIVEGILIFQHETLKKLFDTTICMEISREEFLERRSTETRWGIEPEWYLEHVWNSHLKYGIYASDLKLNGNELNQTESLKTILNRIDSNKALT